ncbi:hypothetical protein AB0D94_19790 [Streptomyces sp. NPDC048255]|uniref:hypothetical protein n=1 Tax=Streptomyces sp. NPDC048255 TaxID=3154713 RepID=UPI0033CFA7C5
MSVLQPALPRLRTLVTYLRGELGRAEQALATAEGVPACIHCQPDTALGVLE